MLDVTFVCEGVGTALECRSYDGHERIGDISKFEIGFFAGEPVSTQAVLGKACCLIVQTEAGTRTIPGIVTSFTAIATAAGSAGRRYRATVQSSLALLDLTTRTRIFQHLTVPDILKKVVSEYAFAPDRVKVNVQGKHEERVYCVQYAESDAAFLRRLCEEEGLYFRSEEEDGNEHFVLEDTSTAAIAHPHPVYLAKAWGAEAGGLTAFEFRTSAQRRAGKVSLRDYDYEKPNVKLNGKAVAGTDLEQATEVYEAPGRFSKPDAGDHRATLRLESLRATASQVFLKTNAAELTLGVLVTLQLPPSGLAEAGTPEEGDYFIVGATHSFSSEGKKFVIGLELIPKNTPFRLPIVTPKPKVHGIHTARVSGAAGEEIHTDKLGRNSVKFPFDREGPGDEKSSLWIRTLQANMPGSMIIPRVGWEVMVAFEDCDPDRPYVLGRTYNAKQPPPRSLPENKTMTCVGTYSSPGGAKQNIIEFDDASGRQHLSMSAGFAMSTSVANNMMVQTAKNENTGITGSQSTTVGGKEDVSVAQAYLVKVGSQSATVGGTQKIWAKGDMAVGVGSETVLIGGALLEKVGDPVAGAKALAKAAALQGVGSLGQAGAMLSKAYTVGSAAVAGYQKGGLSGAASAVGGAAVGMGLGMIPGADAIQASVQGSSSPAPWSEKSGPAGAQAGGGGGTGSTDAAAAKGPGPGYRGTNVSGAMTELIGGSYNIITPGTIGWKTTGASTFLVGGSHTVKTAKFGTNTLGASIEKLGSLKIESAGGIARAIKGALKTSISGALSNEAGGEHSIQAGAALTLKVGGDLKLDGGHVSFKVGGSVVSITGSGLTIEASTIKLTKSYKQSGTSGHG